MENFNKETKNTRNLAKRTHEMLRRMANTDSLTGLFNQRGVVTMTESVLADLKREDIDPTLTITMLDMIGLKALNIKHTELGANKFIKRSADSISKSIRESDIAGRWAGDEFVIVSFDTDTEGTRKLIDKVKNAQPNEIKFNAVYKIFKGQFGVSSALDEVFASIEKVKATLPQDKTGRSIGTGVTIELD